MNEKEIQEEIKILRDTINRLKELSGKDDSSRSSIANLERELRKYERELRGSGAIAQGDGAKAVGRGSIIIKGNVSGGNIIVGDAPRSDAEALSVYCRELVESSSLLPLSDIDIGATDPTDRGTAISMEVVYIDLNTTSLDEEDKEK